MAMEELGVPTFGDWLRETLDKKERSASWFARQLKIKPQTVAAYLSGTARPGRDKIPLIATTLEIKEEIVWDAWRETPSRPYSDTTLSRLLELPDDLRRDEMVLLKHFVKAMRSAEGEMEEGERRDQRTR